ncbi:MAG: dephospho-CoA kinase [Paludibacteraceae bacterium]|nr:dephospho-CoA kinase [Paludibacteraceae bacterium]
MIIGITGGIGSGKSTIAKQLREMGYAVYDTDSEAKRLIVEDAGVREEIEQLFGKEVYKDGVYQTALVAQRVFADRSLLARLNAIVHPAVKADILRWAENINHPTLCFVECAILYQAGFDTLCDKVVVVTAPEEVRLQRAVARDHSTIEKVRARMRAQEVEKDIERADLIVNNDGKTEITAICLQIRDFFCNFAG